MAGRLIRATPALAEIETNLRRQEQSTRRSRMCSLRLNSDCKNSIGQRTMRPSSFTRHRLKETRLHDLARITGAYGSERGQPPFDPS
jgi:hypothetical protein